MQNITQEEVSKLTRAMKDKQFQSHMDEYCKEISDPAHRKEYLQYLDQLEAKGEMPEGQCLLRSEPGCCVKTTIKFKNGQNQKCFINIVHSDQLADMEELPDDKGGKRVHLPYSLSPPRPERDNKDENCMTCDFAISTWTFGQAIQRPQILKMLVDTASDGLGGQFLKGHEEVKKDFKVMRRIRCRGPGARPLPMSVKAELLKDKGKRNNIKQSSVESKSAVTPSELKEMRKAAKEKQLKPSEPQGDDDEEEAVPKTPQDFPESSQTAGGAPRIRVPKHKLVHSGCYDLTDFMEASNRPTMLAQSVPKLLKLIIELPSVKKVSDISLDVTSSNVCIEVADKYYLDLPLSYEIDEEKGDAKFDKVKQTLTLELPVKPKLPDPNLIANRGGFPTTGDAADEDEDGDDDDGALSDHGGIEDDLPPLEDPSEESAVQPPAVDAELSPPTPVHREQPKVSAPTPQPEDLVPEEELPRFVPSDSFTGARPGYVFKTDEEGLGYYRDRRQKRPARESVSNLDQTGKHQAVESDDVPLVQEIGDGAPLIEEIDDGDFVVASTSSKAVPERAPVSAKVQQYIESTSLVTSTISASQIDEDDLDTDLTLDCHQTRQNLLLLVDILAGHEVAGVQLSCLGRRLTITFCTRPVGGERWRRHHMRRTLCRAVDLRQWHVEPPKQDALATGTAVPLLIVVRKAEQGERWPEIFDRSAAAVAADREPIVLSSIEVATPADACSIKDHTAAADTAAGIDVDVVEDSAELDIAAPAGAPEALGPTHPLAKDIAASAGGSAKDVPFNQSAATAAAQSASVMGQAVLLRTRLMYQLF